MELKDFHLTSAKKCYNSTWDFIDMKERSVDQNIEMIRLAQASRYHWGEVGSALEFERGEWLISKVYALLGYGDLALVHAQKCFDICKENDIADFDICFAHEALAKAYKVIGIEEKISYHAKIATQLAENIKDKGDKEYTLSELSKI